MWCHGCPEDAEKREKQESARQAAPAARMRGSLLRPNCATLHQRSFTPIRAFHSTRHPSSFLFPLPPCHIPFSNQLRSQTAVLSTSPNTLRMPHKHCTQKTSSSSAPSYCPAPTSSPISNDLVCPPLRPRRLQQIKIRRDKHPQNEPIAATRRRGEANASKANAAAEGGACLGLRLTLRPFTLLGAKKKNKKKKSAAAKASAAPVAATDASPTEPTGPAASTEEPETQNGADRDDAGEVVDELSKNDAAVPTREAIHGPPFANRHWTQQKPDIDTETPADITTPPSPTKPSTNGEDGGNGHTRSGSTANGHAVPFHSKTDITDAESTAIDKDGDKDTSTASRNGDQSSNSAATSAPSSPTTTVSKATSTTPRAATTLNDGPEGESDPAELERLRQQVAELQKAQESHEEETKKLRSDLEEIEAQRDAADSRYDDLVTRVEKLKENISSRFLRDKEELEENRERIEELEAENERLLQAKANAEASTAAAANEVARLQRELDVIDNEHDREQEEIRNRTHLSQQNWQREKKELMQQLENLQKELINTREGMNDWEVIALEERNRTTLLESKASDLEEQVGVLREQYERAAEDRDAQAATVESLQRSLEDLQNARRHELREMVQESEAKLDAAETRAQKAEKAAAEANEEAEELRTKLAHASTMEVELKEKTAALAKLRHESLGLNEHLIRALRFIKKMKPEEAVEQYVTLLPYAQVMTNLLLQFLQIDRSDPKKFQVLQVIAGMLHWTDDEKERAGLARPGTSSSSLRLPASPFGRTPSTPSLNTEFQLESSSLSGPPPTNKSLSTMFKAFLEESVNETSAPPVSADDPLLTALLNTRPAGSRSTDTKASNSISSGTQASDAGPSPAGPSGAGSLGAGAPEKTDAA
ncbi:golgi family matrix protein [Sporothrix schenckii 1099-18]|uniref:Golgi family matrix protein n=1 Tax=Sporothrix schenckii 1099-18 TaxID=1397361 RepID=A0A0F2MFL6_SPOSC|nr:golgi family matrix protein [Sporothrix schenckii 1099-18]KJR86941.1 golgi family matrix protein [Sporothrix schenckii 1099-18]